MRLQTRVPIPGDKDTGAVFNEFLTSHRNTWYRIPDYMKMCWKCGKPHEEGAEFCEYCGASFLGDNPMKAPSGRTSSEPVEHKMNDIRALIAGAAIAFGLTILAGFVLSLFIMLLVCGIYIGFAGAGRSMSFIKGAVIGYVVGLVLLLLGVSPVLATPF